MPNVKPLYCHAPIEVRTYVSIHWFSQLAAQVFLPSSCAWGAGAYDCMCMYVCMYIHMYVCVYCVYWCGCMCYIIYICRRISYIYAYVLLGVGAYVRTYVYMWVCGWSLYTSKGTNFNIAQPNHSQVPGVCLCTYVIALTNRTKTAEQSLSSKLSGVGPTH